MKLFSRLSPTTLTPVTSAYVQLHFCVFLWGFTAVAGRLISLDAHALVWWRMLLVVVLVALLPGVHKEAKRLPIKYIAGFALVGALVAIHWLLFFAAIKLANVSVGVICMAAAPVFMSIVEPLITRRPFNLRELVLAVAVIPGIVLIVGGIPGHMYIGFAIGILAALIASIFSALNKRMVARAKPLTVTFVEFAAGVLLLTCMAPFLPHTGHIIPWPDWQDFGWLLVLSLGCTLLPFAMLLNTFKHISAFAAQMATNLEPVYAILLAMLIFDEQAEVGSLFYLGVVILLLAIFLHPVVSKRTSRRKLPRFTEKNAS